MWWRYKTQDKWLTIAWTALKILRLPRLKGPRLQRQKRFFKSRPIVPSGPVCPR